MQDYYICCFTGHRGVPKEHARLLPEALDALLTELYGKGIRVFRAGGALGFDTMAALSVLRLKNRYPDVKLELCLPCRDQASKWSLYSKMLYEKILKKSDEVRYAGDKYTSSCMFERNRMLVNGSHVCVAYYNGESGGTGYTYSYAQRSRIEIINLYDTFEKH